MLCYHCPHTNRITDIQKILRLLEADYFYGPGQVQWQWDILVWGLDYRGWNNRNLYCQLKLWAKANGARGSDWWGVGLQKFLGSKMPLDWLKIGLNLAEKIMLLSLRIPFQIAAS